jgi:hypothetical protein
MDPRRSGNRSGSDLHVHALIRYRRRRRSGSRMKNGCAMSVHPFFFGLSACAAKLSKTAV